MRRFLPFLILLPALSACQHALPSGPRHHTEYVREGERVGGWFSGVANVFHL